jgi:hypothetical protein
MVMNEARTNAGGFLAVSTPETLAAYLLTVGLAVLAGFESLAVTRLIFVSFFAIFLLFENFPKLKSLIRLDMSSIR